jgi:hypothetical protein
MPSDISPTTGEVYYSGTWTDIRNVLRTFDIHEGKLAKVNQTLVNFYQEIIDRDVDGILEPLYHVPLRAMNQVQPDGVTRKVFPGDVKRATIYWSAGLLILTEFSGLQQNTTEQAQNYIESSRRQIYDIIRFTHRIPGQRQKSNISRTMPPGLQPPDLPQANF